MSQNKTIIPGVDASNLQKEGAADTFYDALYSRTSADNNRTCIGGGEMMGVPQNAPLSGFVNSVAKPNAMENIRTIKVKERVVVGVLFSISKGLFGEIFPIYLGKNIIGKSAHCDMVLGENTVSEQHAILYTRKRETGMEVSITDFDSMCGTLVNNNDARYETLPVHENDVITIGRHYRCIIKLFETERYGLCEDPEFEHLAPTPPTPEQAATGDTQYKPADDFYQPSANSDKSSRTVIIND